MKSHKKIGQRDHKIYSMHLEGYKTLKIAKDFNLTDGRVRQIIRKMRSLTSYR